MDWFDWATGALVGIPATMGLAAVALIGYLFGRRSTHIAAPTLEAVGPRELHRAARVARQLESTVEELRKQLAEHSSYIDRFKNKAGEAIEFDQRSALHSLSNEAEQVSSPTSRLASQLSLAYDELRRQSQVLASFTEGRTDPITGLGNTPALEEQLALASTDRGRGDVPASLALVSVAPPDNVAPGSEADRAFVRRLAGEIEKSGTSSNYVARLGGVEFAVLMPRTSLAGGQVFGRRLRKRLFDQCGLEAAVGIAEAAPGDSAHAWFSRADSALYSARAENRGGQFVHTGERLQSDLWVPSESTRPLISV